MILIFFSVRRNVYIIFKIECNHYKFAVFSDIYYILQFFWFSTENIRLFALNSCTKQIQIVLVLNYRRCLPNLFAKQRVIQTHHLDTKQGCIKCELKFKLIPPSVEKIQIVCYVERVTLWISFSANWTPRAAQSLKNGKVASILSYKHTRTMIIRFICEGGVWMLKRDKYHVML